MCILKKRMKEKKGWKHIEGELLSPKKVMYNEYIVSSKLKSWWHPLTIWNIIKKLKILHDNILKLKVHFTSKLFLIQWLDEDIG